MAEPREKKSKPIKFESGFTGEGESDATPEELAEEFGDSESADFAAAEAEKADPEDRKNQP